MSKVYHVSSLYGEEYFNTAKESDRCKPGGEEPESVVCLDPAGECNRLAKDVADAERTINALRMLLEDLVNSGGRVEDTQAWARVVKFVEENPLPPAGSAHRDGQRSYGTG